LLSPFFASAVHKKGHKKTPLFGFPRWKTCAYEERRLSVSWHDDAAGSVTPSHFSISPIAVSTSPMTVATVHTVTSYLFIYHDAG
jgi:hypothetical protein